MIYFIVESRAPLTDGVLAEGRVAAPRFFRLLFFPALSPESARRGEAKEGEK